jgi:hypothetical protein
MDVKRANAPVASILFQETNINEEICFDCSRSTDIWLHANWMQQRA